VSGFTFSILLFAQRIHVSFALSPFSLSPLSILFALSRPNTVSRKTIQSAICPTTGWFCTFSFTFSFVSGSSHQLLSHLFKIIRLADLRVNLARTNTMEAGSNSHLTRLPVELIEGVGSLLDVYSLGSLRLSCRAIERALFRHFVQRFFHTRQVVMPPAAAR
jgi:hypothetical protein